MRTRWFDRPLETIALLWHVERADGIALGFAAHDRDISIAHIIYHAAPGMLPSAIEMDDSFDPLDMDIGGVLSHGLIRADDLAAGRWDSAAVKVGLTDWERPDEGAFWFWRGHLGAVSVEGQSFSAELRGLKARLDEPFVPVTSPSCRAIFCGKGCGLSRARYERVFEMEATSEAGLGFIGLDAAEAEGFVHGSLRWISGGNAGLAGALMAQNDAALVLDGRLADAPQPGDRAVLMQGCDKSLATCAGGFGNTINFRGEPHLPGNDLLTRFASF
ncbi:DUF2163 domain-containing protein [Blastomonas sp. AAP53]|uniref:DUF2163 domain-containing protein n=1 Tax=Blastomonas sp. AAP53 TaxID=1248760 RepID=UPI00030993BA|nr:DUF2163 domain-containing protein [Blastomonas sp. AAP53]